ncbi:uncharacterized protein SPPG_09076 [Spizellomyces punctatus DAOM BR117]|uniref:Major facilitator superfamily (MFS) profile domain-containing protein n=1 Tax=Spizellomyces punctatus (strain DAOM BR117) TaxID=645134 RepID=A0A0L0HN66_SPIPD|nr:uncharacterized protein SPPG_09076 [Spizellomyces punctatus DAOM BR117]KND02532.1 hypothetical protein SPPG_09076 [Spizellomyces punctatus DAOM BR117]|eukprot:XP_016610571.1 hypothetical protein SPPG_09076 [Spizellomyces punctatus DAOM BR117]
MSDPDKTLTRRVDLAFDYTLIDDEALANHYQPRADYEGRHRWDPKASWTAEEEKKLVRKIDLRIMLFVCLMFFALQLDRGNISQALSDNMLKDLHLTTNDFNYGQTIFFLSFLSAELPSQLVSKKLGPDNWIPIQMVLWSAVAISQAWLTGRTTFFITRALLGILEGGFIPDVVLYLTYFYKSNELPIRLSWFWTAYTLTNVVSAFMAFGILHLRGVNGWEGWRWLFSLEGALTVILGIVAFFYLPPSPTQTASKFRGKDGWFSEREEVIMVTRILRDDPSKGDMHNRQPLTPRKLFKALTDWDMLPIYIIGLTWLIPSAPPTQYLTLTLRSLGFDTFQTSLLTIPSSILFIGQLLFWTWISERYNEKSLLGVIGQVWLIVLLVSLTLLPDEANPWVRFTILSLIIGFPYVHAIFVAWTSRNAGSVRTRTVASALYNMTVQASNIIASNIYRDDDKPHYRRGNKILIGIAVMNIFIFLATKVYYIQRNRYRERKWSAMSKEDKKHYLQTTTDEGNKRLDFRFAH